MTIGEFDNYYVTRIVEKAIKPQIVPENLQTTDIIVNQSALLAELTVCHAKLRKWPFVIPGLDSSDR